MTFNGNIQNIIRELDQVLSKVNEANTERLIEAVLNSDRIFSAGAGRSGFMIKSFAMRLMHFGFQSFVVGETITPGIQRNDLLIIGSGSGETESLVVLAEKAKKAGAALSVVTAFPESSLGRRADILIEIPAPTPKSKLTTGTQSIQPMGSLFEQGLLLFFDAVIVMLMEKKNTDSDALFMQHANLE